MLMLRNVNAKKRYDWRESMFWVFIRHRNKRKTGSSRAKKNPEIFARGRQPKTGIICNRYYEV